MCPAAVSASLKLGILYLHGLIKVKPKPGRRQVGDTQVGDTAAGAAAGRTKSQCGLKVDRYPLPAGLRSSIFLAVPGARPARLLHGHTDN